MKPYSQDLRERVIAALRAAKENQPEIAARYGIHLSTVEKWSYRWRTTRCCAALPHASGPKRTLQSCESFLRREIKRQPDVTLEELCARVEKAHGLSVSRSMMCRELQHLRLPRKKSTS